VTVASLLAAAVLLATAGPRLVLLIPLKLTHSRNESPALYRVPASREIPSPASDMESLKRYSLPDFIFRTPWEPLKQIRLENTYAFEFQGGRIMLCSLREEEGRLLKTLLSGPPEESRAMQDLLGTENIVSEFALVNSCLEVTPSAAGLMSTIAELTRIRTLLIVKSAFPGGESIFRFQLDDLRGFQFGRPDNDPHVYVYLYTPRNRLLRLKFSGLTQDEIDRILGSLEPADTAQARSPVPAAG